MKFLKWPFLIIYGPFIKIVFKHVLRSSFSTVFMIKTVFSTFLVEFLTEFYSILNKRPNFYMD
jgi:hypothetical protein